MAENQSTETGNGSNGRTAETAAEKALANIVRGTMPRPLVYLIRFGEKGNKEADIAKRYGTTSGKVADIIKNRNFAYIDEDYKPTEDDKEAAIKWLKQVPGYDEVGTDEVVSAVERMQSATESDAAALTEKRAAARAKNAASAPEGGARTGAKAGGNRGGGKGKGGQRGGASQQDADDLMA